MAKGIKIETSKLNKFIKSELSSKKKEHRLKVGLLKNEIHKTSNNASIMVWDLAKYLNQGNHNTPGRPYNNVALERAIKIHIPLFLNNLNVFNYKFELNKLLENLISDYKQVVDGQHFKFVPNSERTKAKKGFDKPLYEKGLLIKMIHGQLNQNAPLGKGRNI